MIKFLSLPARKLSPNYPVLYPMHIQNNQKQAVAPQIPSVPESELSFETARSSGPGGQNVNKVETKVRVVFDLWVSPSFTYEQKSAIVRSPDIQKHIRRDGRIAVSSQVHRSQTMNKEEAIKKLNELIKEALTPEQERVATKPPPSVEVERRRAKDIRASRKESRRKDYGGEAE